MKATSSLNMVLVKAGSRDVVGLSKYNLKANGGHISLVGLQIRKNETQREGACDRQEETQEAVRRQSISIGCLVGMRCALGTRERKENKILLSLS